MQIPIGRALAFSVFTLVAIPARAQDAQPVEITPYVALASAGASPVGAAVTFPLTSWLSLETDTGYRHSNGGFNALSTNTSLLLLFPRVGRFTPYAAAGVGLAQYGTPVFAADGALLGARSRLALTVNAGGGVKAAVNDQLDLRTDVRWFKRFGDQGGDEFRLAQGLSFDVGRRGQQERVPLRPPIMFSR